MLYERILRPCLFRLDPERVHEIALRLLCRRGFRALAAGAASRCEDPVEVWGLRLRNRLGLAAGFDKNGVALEAWRALGFGFVEVGTVTCHPQPGNPRPRIFRRPRSGALLNRMGFPNEGAKAVAERLARFRAGPSSSPFAVGVNIGKSKATSLEEATGDYLASYRALYEYGDFFVVNVSSPNTPGLRELQRPEQLEPILAALDEHRRGAPTAKPLLVKIAPDLDAGQLREIIDLALERRIDGVVATNTTVDHSALEPSDRSPPEAGGLSGRPLRDRSTELARSIRERASDRLPIVAVGGVFDRADYLAKLEAGATLVEVYTGFVYRGPRIVERILTASPDRARGPEPPRRGRNRATPS